MRRMRGVALLFTWLLLSGSGASLHAQQPPIRPAQGGVNINFQDADLAYVFSALAQSAGLNIMYSNLPARLVTMRTFQPVAQSELPGLIISLAAAYGINVSEGNGFLRLQGGGANEQAPDLRQLYIYQLKHARAPVLAQTLQSLFGVSTITNRPPTAPAQTLNQQIQQLQQQQLQMQRPQVVVGGGIPGALGNVLIVPDEVTNQLLIRATPADYQILQQAVGSLDLRPLQVVIEVVIAEVRRNNDMNVGVEFNSEDLRNIPGREARADLPAAEDPNNFTLRLIRSGEINVEVVLSALSRTGNVRILSRPVIQAQNNQQAIINVGEERPFVQISRTLPTDQAVRDEVVQYRDVSTNLTITPTINADGYVNLALVQEVNNVSNEVQFNAPVIATRSATTQLLARDGQTIVIGGLIDSQEERTRTGIPYLRDIPVIGWLFGSLRKTRINSELFLFLTPHIVESDADADRVRQELERNADLLRSIQPIRPLVRPIQRPDSIRR